MDIPEANAEEVQELIRESNALVVDLWAPWCQPCLQLRPLMDRIADDYDDVVFVSVDVAEYAVVASTYGVRSIPTLLFFRDGELHGQIVGVVERSRIKKEIEAIR